MDEVDRSRDPRSCNLGVTIFPRLPYRVRRFFIN